jgi:hypothetical protein
MLSLFSLYAGGRSRLDETVYRSERDTGHRNRAISHMLRNRDHRARPSRISTSTSGSARSRSPRPQHHRRHAATGGTNR